MRGFLRVGLLLVCVMLFAGCMTTYSTTDGRLSYGNIEGTDQGEFSASGRYIYILHPSVFILGDSYTDRLDDLIVPELRDLSANAARNIVIRDGFTTNDMLLSIFVPVVNWGTVIVEGTAVRQ